MTDVVALAAELLAIPSTTRDEGAVVEVVSRWLVARDWNVTVQEVTQGRGNVWASRKGGGVTLVWVCDSFCRDRAASASVAQRPSGRCSGSSASSSRPVSAQRWLADIVRSTRARSVIIALALSLFSGGS